MKRTVCFIVIFLSAAFAIAQKALQDYTAQELSQKKAAAIASKADAEAAVYDAALKLRTQIDEAKKAEDYEKAKALKEQIAAMKLPAAQDSKTKDLQAQIDKAVAAEDYEKAAALKKEMEALKNGQAAAPAKDSSPPSSAPSKATASSPVKTPAPNQAAAAVPAAPPAALSTPASSSLTKNDIYGSAATYFGVDFSLFNYVSGKKLGEEQKNIKYISAWQKEFAGPTKRLGAWLGKTSFNEEKSMVEGLSLQNLNRQWIVATSRSLSTDQIIPQLQSYKTSSHGLGFVIIPGSFDETINHMLVYYVWFDLDTRAIVHMQEISSKVSPGAMGRWLDGLVAATKTYVDDYYKKRL